MRAFEDHLDMAVAEIESSVHTSRKNVRSHLDDALALVEGTEMLATLAEDIAGAAEAVEQSRADVIDKGMVLAAQTHAIELLDHLRLLMQETGPSDHARALGLE